jgi:putative sigma-54 modulation protein
MKIIIQSPHFTVKDELDSFIRRKISRLAHLHNTIDTSEVCLKLERSDENENKICQVKLSLPGNDLFVSKKCATFEDAVDRSIEALARQIENLKGKMAR